MNSKPLLCAFFLLVSTHINAQNNSQESFIEVQGQAEMEIIPDEIYILITISERTEGREKIGIEAQEISLSEGLTKKGIDIQTLSLADQDASYVPVKWSRKDLMASAQYQLMVKNANEVAIVFELLDELDIQRADVNHVSHSKIEEFYKEVRINALKAAKNKAEYLCEAIGEKCGSVIQITDENTTSPSMIPNVAGAQLIIGSQSLFGMKKEYNPSFRKIKLNHSVYAKFEIGE